MIRKQIEDYRADAGVPLEAISSLSPAQLNAHPVKDTWSIQEIVLHLFDSELIAIHRMRRIIAENNPLLIGYNESEFAQNLFYEKSDPTLAATILKQLRLMMATTLEVLPDEAFIRRGVHSEVGRLELGVYLGKNVDHLRHHMKFLNEKKKMVNG